MEYPVASKKRIKLIIEIDEPPIESFGWGDFPLILQPDDVITSSSSAPSSSSKTTSSAASAISFEEEQQEEEEQPQLTPLNQQQQQQYHLPLHHQENNNNNNDYYNSYNNSNTKRKQHPTPDDSIISSISMNMIQHSIDLTSFGWEDFPCVDESNDTYYSSSPMNGVTYQPSTTITPAFMRRPHVIEVDSSSDEDSDNDNDDDEEDDFAAVQQYRYSPPKTPRPTMTTATWQQHHRRSSSSMSTTSISSSNSNSTSSSSKVVEFSETVQVREYALTVGDHPYAATFSLTLDWNHSPTVHVAMVDHENDHYYRSRRPRRLSALERRERLQQVMDDTAILSLGEEFAASC